MKIYKNAAGVYALAVDSEKNVFSSIDQKFVRISLQQFKAMLPADADKSEALIVDVTSEFSIEESEQAILSKVTFLQKTADLDFYWNSSFDFVTAMITSKRSAILNEGITQTTLDFLKSDPENGKLSEAAPLDKYSFIDKDFCRDDFLEGEFDLKAIFGGRVPQAGDHIVFYSLTDYKFRDEEGQALRRSIAGFCQNFNEYHGIMTDAEHVIGEQYAGSWSVMSLTTPLSLKTFLSSEIVTRRDTFRRAYIVESSNICSIETIRQRLKEEQYRRVIRYANSSFASVIRYCQSGV
ncbi:MAG TPA: hypothetical protein DCR21_01855, partial [Succinivibrionaceae bacterium]|nr:hypothetical protein [Succinivibrionaceae bacterium]